ncbi:acyl-CoA synthetase [Pandoraea terrae]
MPMLFNIGVDVCDKWADGSHRLALIHERADGAEIRLSFDDLKRLSNQLANEWRAQGVRAGDRIGIFLPQSPATLVAHVAAYKLGAIAVPLFTLFGPEALAYRLQNSGATVLVTDLDSLAKIDEVRADVPELRLVYVVHADMPGMTYGGTNEEGVHDADEDEDWGSAEEGLLALWPAIAHRETDFLPVETRADAPALIIYTSGTTGKPKGALHAHRVLLGHLPGVEMSHNGFPLPGDLIWTPADWAWIGGLLDVLLPALHHGVPVLSRRFEKFEPSAAFDLMSRHGVRNAFLPPTALKMLRTVPSPRQKWPLQLRSVASGGETLGPELLAWGREHLGVDINEFYGQTECNMVVSSCAAAFPALPGAIGRAVPGHKVAIVDDEGVPLPAGSVGNIAILRPNPVMFLGYWHNPTATLDKFRGDYLLTGDAGFIDENGYVTFTGRSDDVITSAGYRIGPGPIEDCLIKHPSVQFAAVIGEPDPMRTEIVKAFVVLREGVEPTDALAAEIQQFVKTRLAAHEYPRKVVFLEELPMTVTGKIIRRALREMGQGVRPSATP